MFPSKTAVISGGLLPRGSTRYIELDGTNDYITGSDAKFPIGDTSRSVSMWVHPDATVEWDNFFVYGKETNYKGVAFGKNASDATLSVGRYGGNFDASTGEITNGQWNHVAFTFRTGAAPSPSRLLTYYIDGNAAGTGGTSAYFNTEVPGDEGVVIGSGAFWSASAPFNGKIDEVSIFSRMLSAEEIKELYGGGSPQTAGDARNISDLAGYWKFERGSGVVELDLSGNGATVTLTNGAAWASH